MKANEIYIGQPVSYHGEIWKIISCYKGIAHMVNGDKVKRTHISRLKLK